VKRVIIDLPEQLVEDLKIYTVKNKTSIKAIVEKLVTEFMEDKREV
jgi:hypothetical protein